MLIEAVVGERRAASGVQSDGRSGPFGDLIVNDVGLGRYFESARLGKVYSTLAKAITVAATHNSPIAANTATPVAGIINPANSGWAAVLLRAAFSTVSGTPAGGQAVLNVQADADSIITAAATGSIFSNIVSKASGGQGSQMKVINNVALAGWASGGVAGAVEELLLLGGATAAAVAGNGGPGAPVAEDIAGMVIVPPGALAAIMAGSGAGTTWIVNAGLTWAEVPWPL